MSAFSDPASVDPAALRAELKPAQEIDRVVHEPARLMILTVLNTVEEADFKFLGIATGLTKGNLSRQSSLLEEVGYIQIRKFYKGKIPATSYRLTDQGRAAFSTYWQQMAALSQTVSENGTEHE